VGLGNLAFPQTGVNGYSARGLSELVDFGSGVRHFNGSEVHALLQQGLCHGLQCPPPL
jgi:hypothetical protein